MSAAFQGDENQVSGTINVAPGTVSQVALYALPNND